MKRRKRPQSSVMFLMELLIAIFFFAIASAICVQIFVKAHLLTRHSVELQMGVNACASAAELASSSDSLEDAADALKKAWPDAKEDQENPDCFVIDYEDGKYTQQICLRQEDDLLVCEQSFIVNSDQTTAYALSTVHHLERKRQQ